MALRVRYYTDPACPRSWAAEPALRTFMVEFGADVQITYVMGGLARELGADAGAMARSWLDASGRSGMPVDPRLWWEGPIRSSYPACMAVKAAAEQADDGGYGYLRALREGLMCLRRKLDTAEALVEAARETGLDAERFRIDLESHATVEAFGDDLERTRRAAEEADVGGELPFPTLALEGESGTRWLVGPQPYERYREEAVASGATPGEGRPGVLEALGRFRRVAAVEVETVCDLPGPRAHAELWALAAEWRARPVPVLAGHLWESA